MVKVVFRHRAAGVENVPRAGGFVLAANHWSSFDPLRVAYGAPIQVDDLADLPGGEAARIATDRLAEAVTALEQRVA